MLSPYNQSKQSRGLEEPEVRSERQYGQRLLIKLRQEEHLRDKEAAEKTQRTFSTWATKAFPETLRELAPDLHAACDWAAQRATPSPALCRAVVLFCGNLINSKETAISIQLLRKVRMLVGQDRELSSLCSINSAIAHKQFAPHLCEDAWLLAINQMPLNKWHLYPSLAIGCFTVLRDMRASHEQQENLPGVLIAGTIAERAFKALTLNEAKSVSFQSMPAVVGMLIEIAAIKKANDVAGLSPLHLPPAGTILKLAAVNAGANSTEPELFIRALIHLSHHHVSEGEPLTARDYAIQAMAECTRLPEVDPDLPKAIALLLKTTTE
jgi:hypothetical protein